MLVIPLQYDQLTSTISRLSYARVLVEVNLMDILPYSINVLLTNGSTLAQLVVYETPSKLCKPCKVFSHSTVACSLAGEPSKLAPQVRNETDNNRRGSVFQRLSPNGIIDATQNIETLLAE